MFLTSNIQTVCHISDGQGQNGSAITSHTITLQKYNFFFKRHSEKRIKF